MRRHIFSLLLAALLLLTSCAGREEETAEPVYPTNNRPSPSQTVTPEPSAVPEDLPPEAPVWGVQESSCRRSLEEEDVLLVEGKFALPYIENAEGRKAYEAINLWYLNLSAGLRSDTLANAPMAEDDYRTSKAMGYAFSNYVDEEIYTVTWETEGFANILRTHYGLVGGVYPHILYLSDRFDLSTGERLAFAACFADPDLAEEVIYQEVMRQVAERPELDSAAAESCFDREYFYLTEDALVLFYQPEVLAPHAAGIAEFSIPREMLEGLLWK